MKHRRSSSTRRSPRRGLTTAQQAAHDKAYAACDYTTEGRFVKGQVVADYHNRQAWTVVTYGIRYHEDVTSCIYGVKQSNGPNGWKESVAIREAMAQVKTRGTHEIGSRGGDSESQHERPGGAKLATWTDKRFNSLATCETISVYDGGVVGLCEPIYDDSPVVMWLKDAALAKRLLALIERCPEPVVLPTANVKERTVKLTIAKEHPRYATYAAARDARPYEPVVLSGRTLTEGGIELPRAEQRKIKAELDASDTDAAAEEK